MMMPQEIQKENEGPLSQILQLETLKLSPFSRSLLYTQNKIEQAQLLCEGQISRMNENRFKLSLCWLCNRQLPNETRYLVVDLKKQTSSFILIAFAFSSIACSHVIVSIYNAKVSLDLLRIAHSFHFDTTNMV